MPLKLVRIDDRLIHGQVVLGWLPVVKPDRMVVANDRVASSDWERKFYASCVPPDIRVSFLSVADTARQLLNNLFKNEGLMILFESARDVCAVVDLGVEIREVNVGGLHYRQDSVELLPFVYVTEEDRTYLRELVKKRVTLSAQDVPTNAARVINSLVV